MQTRVAAGVIALLAGAFLMHAWDARAPGSPRGPTARAPRPAHFARAFRVSRFVRGNLHTHTTASDGDASPADVVRWYRDHGYGFVALTDHNVLTGPRDLAAWVTPEFAVIPGEEVSMYVHGKQVHVNALCTRALVRGGDFPTAEAALAHALVGVLEQGGVALINHPNFDWALTNDDILSADGEQLLEIASGHPYVHGRGDATHPSHEQLWDDALTAGHDVMGVAVDDTHHLVTDADPEAFPGVAWVAVFADEAKEDRICEALRRGALYASTGPELASLEVSPQTYEVAPTAPEASVVFIGAGGRVLARVPHAGAGATYRLVGDEGYVRARVEDARGVAWTPAVRVTRD
jgi:hypothetical protein